ncbi:c-type cytochrome biogenesis protein CcsB [Thermodesulfobacteriota bacterium]
MEILIIITIFFYILSTAGYVAFLFLQNNLLQRAGYYLLVTGFLCHTAFVVWEYVILGHLPVQDLRGTLLVAGWAMAGLFLILQYRFHLKILGIYVAPLATLVIFIASQLPGIPHQTNNIFKSFWLIFHIITVFIGDAAFALACGVGLFYLIQERAIKTKTQGFFFRRLPSLERLDYSGYVCVIVGFTMLTIGLVTGLVYAKLIWGKFWSWDPKEVWSGITWLLYAALLHGRISMGWRGRRAAIMCIIGFGALLFTFFGVNFLMEGHHGKFTRF